MVARTLHSRKNEEGMVLLAALLFALLLGITSSGIYLEHLGSQLQQEKERLLLERGREIRGAIKAYYENTPGPIKQLPKSLEALQLDERLLATTRYIRGSVLDPVSGEPWNLIVDEKGGVLGVKSKSTLTPFKKTGFLEDEDFGQAATVSDWKFIVNLKKVSQ